MDKGKDKAGQATGKVIDLARKKHAKMVLSIFDRFEREDKREKAEKRAEVERLARNRL